MKGERKMNVSECIESLQILLNCMDDKLQGERDKMTKLIDLKPSSFEYVLKETINFLTDGEKPVLRGRWIFHKKCKAFLKDESGFETLATLTAAKCSECLQFSEEVDPFFTYKYCPHCGAQMKGDEE